VVNLLFFSFLIHKEEKDSNHFVHVRRTKGLVFKVNMVSQQSTNYVVYLLQNKLTKDSIMLLKRRYR